MMAFDSGAFDSGAFETLYLLSNKKFKYTNQTDFPNKRPIEVLVFSVDYTPILGVGEHIVSAYWANKVITGADPNPDDMILGGAVLKGPAVFQLVRGGVDGVSYTPHCIATTNTGQVLTLPPLGFGKVLVRTKG